MAFLESSALSLISPHPSFLPSPLLSSHFPTCLLHCDLLVSITFLFSPVFQTLYIISYLLLFPFILSFILLQCFKCLFTSFTPFRHISSLLLLSLFFANRPHSSESLTLLSFPRPVSLCPLYFNSYTPF